jgi:hypothetical protein
MDETKGPLSGKTPTAWQGPKRKAPDVYIGETIGGRMRGGVLKGGTRQIFGGRRTTFPDTERNANGSLKGVRNKISRRVIRKAFLRSHSTVEIKIANARALNAQAAEVARDNKKSTRWARRLVVKELAIHQPVYAPDHKELRAMRTAARKAKRKGFSSGVINDAISAVVDRQAK